MCLWLIGWAELFAAITASSSGLNHIALQLLAASDEIESLQGLSQ